MRGWTNGDWDLFIVENQSGVGATQLTGTHCSAENRLPWGAAWRCGCRTKTKTRVLELRAVNFIYSVVRELGFPPIWIPITFTWACSHTSGWVYKIKMGYIPKNVWKDWAGLFCMLGQIKWDGTKSWPKQILNKKFWQKKNKKIKVVNT